MSEQATPQTTPKSLAQEVSGLFTLPDLVMRALAVIDSPTGTAQELVEVIELDAGLAAMVLRIANSALYGQRGKVDSLTRAVSLIGTRAVRDLAIATSAVKTFKDIPAEFVDMDTFWDNSITCGVLAKLLAQRARVPEGEGLFMAGLLHAVGRLVLYARRPAEYRQVLERAEGNSEAALTAAEEAVFGFTYAEVGTALLEAWNLPTKLQVVVACHLNPNLAPGYLKEVAVVHLANLLAASLAPCLKTKMEPEPFTPDEAAAASMAELDLNRAALEETRLEALAASLEVIEIMHPGASFIF